MNGEPRRIREGLGENVHVSPGGTWLGFLEREAAGQVTLQIYAAGDSISHTIPSGETGVPYDFAFDSAGERLVYLDLGERSTAGLPWALVVIDLESGQTTRYPAVMSNPEDQPLPGTPLGWSQTTADADELIFDTFLPGTEVGWQGVWGVTLPAGGETAPLRSLPLRQLVPPAPVYTMDPHMSPGRKRLAFLGRNPSYKPDGYTPEFYDLAVNRLEILELSQGTRRALVVADDGSALGRALAWSPQGDQILFAQGRYEGQDWASLMLKTADLDGAVHELGRLNMPARGGLVQLAWCRESMILYSTWDGSNGQQSLYIFNMESGIAVPVRNAVRIEIVGCAP
jgi:hypothetical protein